MQLVAHVRAPLSPTLQPDVCAHMERATHRLLEQLFGGTGIGHDEPPAASPATIISDDARGPYAVEIQLFATRSQFSTLLAACDDTSHVLLPADADADVDSVRAFVRMRQDGGQPHSSRLVRLRLTNVPSHMALEEVRDTLLHIPGVSHADVIRVLHPTAGLRLAGTWDAVVMQRSDALNKLDNEDTTIDGGETLDKEYKLVDTLGRTVPLLISPMRARAMIRRVIIA